MSIRLIVEGIDNVGKTTLINGLTKHYKVPFVKLHHYGPSYKDLEDIIAFDIEMYKNMSKIFNTFDYVVADRSHLGSLVYSPLYRDNSGEHVLLIEDLLPNDIILIVLIDDAENVISRDDGLSFTTNLEKKKREIELFTAAVNKSKIKNKIILNIRNKDANTVLHHVIKFIEESIK
jgi:thymidylate kinase